MKKILIFSFLVLSCISQAHAGEKNAQWGFVNLQAYYDIRDFNTITVDTLVGLPYRFQYFSFVNYSSPLDANNNFDTESYYTEQHLRWKLANNLPLHLTTQLDMQSGPNNDVWRTGIMWTVSDTPVLDKLFKKIHLFYTVNFSPIEIDLSSQSGWGMQIEHFYNWTIYPKQLQNRVYLRGFADHNLGFDGRFGGSQSWVTEHQLGLRVVNQFHLVAEYRYNDYLPSSDRSGLGLGVEYQIHF